MEPSNTNTQNTPDTMQSNVPTSAETTAPVVPTAPMTPAENQTAPIVPTDSPMASVVATEKPKAESKKNIAMLIALIICLILALGGVGFGIWAVVDGNTKIERKDTVITTLQNKNTALEKRIEDLGTITGEIPEGKDWAETEVKDGVFYVLDVDGNVIEQSSPENPAVNKVLECGASSNHTVLICKVDTSEGEGQFLYDVFGDSLIFNLDSQ